MIDPIKAARRDFEAAEVYFRLTPTETTRKTYEATRQALAFAEAAAELPASNAAIDDEEDQDERPFPDSDEAIRALQDVAEAVDELMDENNRLRAELKTALSERDNAMRQTLTLPNGICVSMQFLGDGNADCTAFNALNGNHIRVDEFYYDGTSTERVLFNLTSIEVIRFLSNAANMTLSKEIK